MISILLSQVADYGPLVSQFGFGGAVLWVDLAARPYADKFIKDQARRIIAEMDADGKK